MALLALNEAFTKLTKNETEPTAVPSAASTALARKSETEKEEGTNSETVILHLLLLFPV